MDNNNIVKIDHFLPIVSEGYMVNRYGSHIILGLYPEDKYITLDNFNVKIGDQKSNISTKVLSKSRINIKNIKDFIYNYQLGDGLIPKNIIRVRKSDNGIIDAMGTIDEQSSFISYKNKFYMVDEYSNIVENNYDILYFSNKQDKEIAEYIYYNESELFEPIKSKKADIRIHESDKYTTLYETKYFILLKDNFNNSTIFFVSQYDSQLSYITTDPSDDYYVSWADELSKYFIL